MKFVIDFPVTEVSGRTKEEVISKMMSKCNLSMFEYPTKTMTGYSSEHTLWRRRLYYLQKFNKKSAQKQRVVDGKNLTFTKVIRKPSWKAFYIDVPTDMIETAKQYNRHFNLKLKNR